MSGAPVDPLGEATDGPALSVAGAARGLGVAPGTLRSWERRYGLTPSLHTKGGHRRYSPEDVARLRAMHRLVRQGVPPAEAARVVLRIDPDIALDDLMAEADSAPVASPGGGRVLSLPGRARSTRGLARAALALDGPACARAIGASLRDRGAAATWEDLIRPVLAAIGDRWERTGQGVEAEHSFSAIAYAALVEHASRVARSTTDRPVLLASVPDELHDLPLVALGAALSDLRIRSHLLGARMPEDALGEAVVRLGPPVLFLWSQLGPARLPALPAMRPAPTVLVGGPGWQQLPPAVLHVEDLASAVGAVRATLAR